MERDWAIYVVGTIIALLLGGNGFFISRLVEKVDATDQRVWQLSNSFSVLRTSFDDLTERGDCCTHKKEESSIDEIFQKRGRPTS